jgi:hypothetical protein
MNPFGLFQAVAALIETAAHAANPKRRRATKQQERLSLFIYFGFLLACVVIVVWVVRSVYLAR